MARKWQKVGVIGVDAGICWIGDPCYILHKDKKGEDAVPKDIGKDWHEFCARLGDNSDTAQFNYDLGHPGLGVVVSTGYGDGSYDVEVHKTSDGRIAAVRVVFVDEDE